MRFPCTESLARGLRAVGERSVSPEAGGEDCCAEDARSILPDGAVVARATRRGQERARGARRRAAPLIPRYNAHITFPTLFQARSSPSRRPHILLPL